MQEARLLHGCIKMCSRFANFRCPELVLWDACAVCGPRLFRLPSVGSAAGALYGARLQTVHTSHISLDLQLMGLLLQLIQTAGAEARRATIFRDEIMTIEAWMRSEALPHSLRHKIRCYFSGALVFVNLPVHT